jgi:sarcosine oxidase/L-pipecolate oxidase
MSSSPWQRDAKVLIVGAGVFGLTLALELNRRDYKNITILDRYLPPVPDGSSVDISRVVRPDYADQFYADMAVEAIQGWEGEFSPFFHRSGLLSLSETEKHPYIQQSCESLRNLGLSVSECSGDEAKARFPMIHGDISHMVGYNNTGCGWADAEQSILYLARRCTEAGISFLSGHHGTVTSLLIDGKRVAGVRTRAGASVLGDVTIVATGAWTPHLLNMSRSSVSTGQPVGFLQLTAQEAEAMKDCPIIINLSTGWFCFPPTPGTHIFKMARHGYGYETRTTTPETTSSGETASNSGPSLNSNNATSGFIPSDAEQALRHGLAQFFPQFRERDFLRRRLCWYTDTPNGDFIVDYHPDYENLFMACGGSGQ